MDEKKPRKTDRRTLYTRMVIKEALLSLLAEKEYADITIADLCREAEINRGTCITAISARCWRNCLTMPWEG